jgi:hypothetical protein
MRNLIRKILLRESQGENPLSKMELTLFKYIHKRRKEFKKKADFQNFVKDVLKLMSINEDYAKYYTELFLLNYRKEGDYQNITPETFVGPKDFPKRTISNTNAGDYTKHKIPFKGSNLEGEWKRDANGKEIYVVTSYGWYPVYMFRDGIWYEVSQRYSSSTGKQMYASDPVKYDDKIKEEVVVVTKEEMNQLLNGKGYEDIMRSKKEKMLAGDPEYFQKKRLKSTSQWFDAGDNQGWGTLKITFRITGVEPKGEKVLVKVLVEDVFRKHNSPFEPTNGGYLRGEIPDLNKEKVEKSVRERIIYNLKDYVGKRINHDYDEDDVSLGVDPSKYNLVFEFTHKYEK